MSKDGTTPRDGEQGPLSVTGANQMFVTELLRREGRAEEEPPPGRPSRMYRAVAVLAGFVLLCGAVTASTAALSGPRAERAVPSPVAVKAITGADTLRPDLISNWDEVRPPPPGNGSAPEGTGNGSAPEGTGDGHDPPSTERTPRSAPPPDPAAADETTRQPRPTTTTAPLPDEDPRDGLDLNSNSVTDIVSTFYETVTQQPRDAFDLLSPQLQGTGFAEFQRAWADVKTAAVEDIGQDGPHAALVSVRLEQRDGSVLRTRQRVLIIPGVAPRIAEVTLLSAARS